MEIYRERKREILKALIKHYGVSRDYDMYGEFIGYRYNRKCIICGSTIRDYSEWHDTGYEIEECSNGCWSHETYGRTHSLRAKGFYFRGEINTPIMDSFEKQIKTNSVTAKSRKKLFWKKKRSQRKSV